ncbi:MAG: alpha/beta hydrolase [Rhodospirillales bacterium]
MTIRRLALAGLVAAAVAGCAPVVIPAGPPVTTPVLRDDRLVAADGAALPVRSWLPDEGPPAAVVIALHGFNDYGRFFADAGRFLAARGVASYAYDQRGFGAAPHPGRWPGAETLTADLAAAVAAVRGRHPGVPLFLLGESMGGAVILVAMAGADPPAVDGVILAAPAVWGRATMPWYQTAALWVAAHSLPWLPVSGRGLKIAPSDNVEMLRALGRDPLVIKETRVDAVWGLVDLMDAALAAGERLDAPALILYGERDQLIPPEPLRLLLARLPEEGRDRLRIALYAQGYHMLLRDLQAETVWADIAAWIADPAAPLPSRADRHAAESGACPSRTVCAIVPWRRTRSSAG